MYTPGEILNLAILIEENGESFYLDVAKLAKDPHTKLLLERLASEERIHRERFIELKRDIDKLCKPDALEKISRFLTAEAIGTRLFSLESKKASYISSIEEAIQLAITLEEDSLIFYELLKSLSDRIDSIQILDRIISEERSHLQTLSEIAKSLEANFNFNHR